MTAIYVTKYALTRGPFKVEGELKFNDSMAAWQQDGYHHSAHNKDFWLTPEEALADCERRKEAKIKSCEKQIKKLQAMTFSIN